MRLQFALPGSEELMHQNNGKRALVKGCYFSPRQDKDHRRSKPRGICVEPKKQKKDIQPRCSENPSPLICFKVTCRIPAFRLASLVFVALKLDSQNCRFSPDWMNRLRHLIWSALLDWPNITSWQSPETQLSAGHYTDPLQLLPPLPVNGRIETQRLLVFLVWVIARRRRRHTETKHHKTWLPAGYRRALCQNVNHVLFVTCIQIKMTYLR